MHNSTSSFPSFKKVARKENLKRMKSTIDGQADDGNLADKFAHRKQKN